ncbi:MAG: PD-(D/E)XK nuclease domain-containing protein [Deltaproteobacteria bacterium]|nr:PD-(D/E)XK nuclease domain-containing protein [Deltaproteobacteria bacterium]
MSDVNYYLHLPYEAYYQTVFQFVLELSGHAYDSQGPVGDGRYDLHFISSAGDDYVVEIKYVKASDDDENKAKFHQSNKPSKVILKQISHELARLKAKMVKAAGEAMAQIDLKKYVNKFQGGNNKIYKVALIFGGRTQVAVVIVQD